MEVTVIEHGVNELELRARVPADQVADRIERETNSVLGHVTLPGFRPGKAPRRLVEARYASHVMASVRDRLLDDCLREAVKPYATRLVRDPRVEGDPQPVRGEDFSCVIMLEVFESFELPDCASYACTVYDVDITEADVDNALLLVRRGRSTYSPVVDPAPDSEEARVAENDRLTVLWRRRAADGTLIEGEEPRQDVVELCRTRRDVVDALIGCTVGGTVEFPSTDVDEVSGVPDEPGTMVVCQVLSRERGEMPEADDAFAASVGTEATTVAELRDVLRNQLWNFALTEHQKFLYAKLAEFLLDKCHFSVPKSMIDARVADDIEEDPQMEPMRDQLARVAEQSLRLELIFREIYQQQKFPFTVDAVLEFIQANGRYRSFSEQYVRSFAEHFIASLSDQSPAAAEKEHRGEMLQMQMEIVRYQVVKHCVSNGTVTRIPVDFYGFQEAMLAQRAERKRQELAASAAAATGTEHNGDGPETP
jgi:trigger factor